MNLYLTEKYRLPSKWHEGESEGDLSFLFQRGVYG